MSSATRRRSALRTVDALAGCSDDARVYEDDAGVVWHFMLNFTNLSFGTYGNNKFYSAQLIQDGSRFMVFRRWGRVGAKNPQRKLEHYNGSLEKAMASFEKKFLDKSGNEWPLEQGQFEKVPGKYVLVELDDEEPEADAESPDADGTHAELTEWPVETEPSTLDQRVQDVLKLVCDADLIAQEVAAMKLDLKRLPLGRLSKAQISQGYSLLEQLSATITDLAKLAKPESNEEDSEQQQGTSKARGQRRSTRPKRSTATTTRTRRIRVLTEQVKQLSSEFYSLIPHDFGRNLPPPIDSMEEVRLKIDLLEVLADIEIAQKLQQEKQRAGTQAGGMHPLDAQYHMLDVEMEPVLECDEDFKTITRYVETTHAPTHVQYKLQIRSVLKLRRREEDAFHDTFQSVSNHVLLWHGSRLCNMVGILAKGLRVAPPEAPTNGYMFGKGIYFADSVSKSANYCWTTPEQPMGVLLLAEVALGTAFPALEAEDLTYDKLRKTRGYDSLHGLGRMAAPAESREIMRDGVVVPVGEFEPTGVENGELLYNEFVVYRKEQVRLRYLVALDFVYDA